MQTQSNRRQTQYTQTNPTGGNTAQGIPIQPTHTGDTLITAGTIAKYMQTQTTNIRVEPNTVYKNIASNSSVLNGHGTFGWVKETVDNKIQEGNGEVTGGPGEMNSYRTEAQGAAEILLWTPPESILNATLYIDNKGVVRHITQEIPIHPLQAKWELLEPTRQYINKIKHSGTYSKPPEPTETYKAMGGTPQP